MDNEEDKKLTDYLNELNDDINFFLPDGYQNIIKETNLSKEIIQIFYIARVIFNPLSDHPIKGRLSNLWNREKKKFLPDEKEVKTDIEETSIGNFIDVKKIENFSQIANLLPRDLLIYPDKILFDKLLKRQLYIKSFQDPKEKTISVSTLVDGVQQKLNRSQKVYILFDNSTSMSSDNINKFFTAKAVALEYLRKVAPENPQIYFRSFHSELGELIKTKTTEDVQELIKYIINLTTGGGHITIVGDAIFHAIEEIESDPDLKDAEILVITDGCGPISDKISSKTKKIKCNIILIPDTDIEKILKLYPTRDAWDAADPKQRKMPDFWHYYENCIFLEQIPSEKDLKTLRLEKKKISPKEIIQVETLVCLGQIYDIKEYADLFLIIPSILAEKFIFNPEELKIISEYRLKIEKDIANELSGIRLLSILRKISFIIEYLKTALDRGCTKEVYALVSEELNKFILQKNKILANPWVLSMRIDSDSKQKKMQNIEQDPFLIFINLIKKLKYKFTKIYSKFFNH